MIRLAEIYYRHIKKIFIYAWFTLLFHSFGVVMKVWNNNYEVIWAWLLVLTVTLWILIFKDYEDCK